MIFVMIFFQLNCAQAKGLPAYSDSAGTMKKCHFKQVSLYPRIYSMSFSDQKTCHCSRSVTLSGVTVSGEAFTVVSGYSDTLGLGKSVTITDCHYNSVTLIVINESGIAKTVTLAGV